MKLKNIFFAVLAVGVMSLTSCKDEKTTDATPTQTLPETNDTKTTAALNPAHGQPGHTCALPVGAPLDQAPASNTVEAPINTGVSPVRLNSSASAPQINPPHGQPGHDCAVPVGADLNQSR